MTLTRAAVHMDAGTAARLVASPHFSPRQIINPVFLKRRERLREATRPVNIRAKPKPQSSLLMRAPPPRPSKCVGDLDCQSGRFDPEESATLLCSCSPRIF